MTDGAAEGIKTTELAPELRAQLLVYLGDRLTTGDVIIMAEQFAKAAEEGFVTLTGETVTDQIRQALAQFVAADNGGSDAVAGPRFRELGFAFRSGSGAQGWLRDHGGAGAGDTTDP
ncbi:MAG: hypothetical protein VCF24_15220 [Candidatus Latescibacterota bacterium]